MGRVRLSGLKLRFDVFHGVRPDEFSIRLAEYEGILLVCSRLESAKQLVKALRHLYSVGIPC
jgi:predicted transcriptional regulator